MYIKVTLATKSRNQLKSIHKQGNTSYLVKGTDNAEFPYLSQVESDDYSVFEATDMDGIISELLRVREEVEILENQQHIDDIIQLAKECKETPNTVLVFAG
jgi:hypothetical protein